MSEWYFVTQILDSEGMFAPVTKSFGNVELRPSDFDSPCEELAIAKSRKFFGLRTPNPDVAMRITTAVQAENALDAHTEAERIFDAALDVIDAGNSGLQRYVLSKAGYIRKNSDGHIEVIKARITPTSYTGYEIVRGEVQPLSIEQILLGEGGRTELGLQIRRSLHWARKLRWESNTQLRILFRWFSMESILMEYKNDDIVPRILTCLGLFTGKVSQTIREDIMTKHQSYLGYSAAKDRAHDLLVEIHGFRHDSVHGGFRAQDIAEKTLQKFDKLSEIAFDFVHVFARQGLLCRLKTRSELLEYLGVIFELLEEGGNLCERLHEHIYPNIIEIAK